MFVSLQNMARPDFSACSVVYSYVFVCLWYIFEYVWLLFHLTSVLVAGETWTKRTRHSGKPVGGANGRFALQTDLLRLKWRRGRGIPSLKHAKFIPSLTNWVQT